MWYLTDLKSFNETLEATEFVLIVQWDTHLPS